MATATTANRASSMECNETARDDYSAMSESTTSTFSEMNDNSTTITMLRPADILLGRGAPMVCFVGNVEYRKLIRLRQDEFCRTKVRARKSAIAKQVLAAIQERNGRFLQRVKPSSHDTWRAIPDSEAIVKIKQALRHRSSKSVKFLPTLTEAACAATFKDDKAAARSVPLPAVNNWTVDPLEVTTSIARLGSPVDMPDPSRPNDVLERNPTAAGDVFGTPSLSQSQRTPTLQHQQLQHAPVGVVSVTPIAESSDRAARLTRSDCDSDLTYSDSESSFDALLETLPFIANSEPQLRIEQEAFVTDIYQLELRREQLNVRQLFLNAQKASIPLRPRQSSPSFANLQSQAMITSASTGPDTATLANDYPSSATPTIELEETSATWANKDPPWRAEVNVGPNMEGRATRRHAPNSRCIAAMTSLALTTARQANAKTSQLQQLRKAFERVVAVDRERGNSSVGRMDESP